MKYRKFEINDGLFLEITNPWESYFLGFLMADGCVTKNKISLSILKEDEKILHNFLDKIYPKNKPIIGIRKLSEKNEKWGDIASINICSQEIYNNVKKYGLLERKTKMLVYPNNLPDKLFSHFLRGYFDGDGSFYDKKNRDNVLVWQMTGTLSFLNEVKHILREKLEIDLPIYPTTSSKFVYEMKTNKKETVLKLGRFMYKDCGIFFLERKKNKFDNFQSNYKPNKQTYSKYKGVTFDKNRDKWKSSLWVNGKTINLGRFDNETDAINSIINFKKNETN
jgi:hypothetical protein